VTAPRPIPPATRHGGDAASIARALGVDPCSMVDLSASMNPLAPDVTTLLTAQLQRDPGLVGRYPDPTDATQRLAQAMDIDVDLVVLTNGGAEAIALVAAESPTGSVIEPEFSLYRRHLTTVDSHAPRWRSNPSNPLGVLAAPTDRAGVWDEAFYPITTGEWTRGDADAWRVGSLTKLWNCPGLRLGYVIAPNPDAAQQIRHRQPQWAVNGLALAAIPDLLERTDLSGWSDAIAHMRREFVVALIALGYEVGDTCVNWLLIHRPYLRAALVPHGVVVRDCASFGLPDVHRVALPTAAHFDRVVAAFAAEAAS
jgi:histidinol-phosphate/aromatic aminotransferase/cobyric acid decarboxylase-like protein